MGQWHLLSLEAEDAKILVGSPLKMPGTLFQRLSPRCRDRLLTCEVLVHRHSRWSPQVIPSKAGLPSPGSTNDRIYYRKRVSAVLAAE